MSTFQLDPRKALQTLATSCFAQKEPYEQHKIYEKCAETLAHLIEAHDALKQEAEKNKPVKLTEGQPVK